MKTSAADKLRVLVAEGQSIAREILADLLRMAGYDVVVAQSGEEALLTLVRERGRLDCLVTAVELPGLVDGWMVADEFRNADPARPVVFSSAGEVPDIRRSEVTAFVGAPALPPKLVEAVNEVTGRTAALMSLRSAPRPAEAVSSEPASETSHISRPEEARRAAG